MSQQLTMTDASGTTTNTYDVLGRVLSEVNGRGNKLSYEYDVAGRRTALVDPENGRTTYAYDANGWLLRLTDPQNGATVYAYDKLGRELNKTLPNGVTSSHVYNAVGDETLLEERDANNTLLSRYASTYNNTGLKLSVTEKDGSVVTYRYYLNYALAREERTANAPYVTEYFYDAAGNHLRTVRDGAQTSTFLDAANQIIKRVGPNGTVNFAYDADGNLSNEVAPDGSGKSYFFDGQNQLVAVEVKSAGGVLSHRSEFNYDGFGRLVKSTEFTRSGTSWLKQSETGRVFDGLDTVQERGENNQVMAQLTRDGNIGGILSRKVGANTSFFGYDGNGNVTLLSDAQGNGVGHYRYDGFGNALEVTGSSAQENDHRFSTKELHAPSGLYYYGFRFYSPSLGSWINRDPIREAGGVNLYQMVGSNPTNLIDFHGLDYLFNVNGVGIFQKGFSLWGGAINILGGSIAEGKQIRSAFATILSTPTGKKILKSILKSKKPIYVHIGKWGNPSGETSETPKGSTTRVRTGRWPWQYYEATCYVDDPNGKGGGNEIWINPAFSHNMNTLLGPQPLPFDVQIVHELGHAVFGVGDSGPDRMANVNISENPYRLDRQAQLLKARASMAQILRYTERESYP